MAEPSEQGRVIDGRYVLGPSLGAGGMGVVYRAHHRFTGVEVALKLLHAHFGGNPDVAARFQAEARAPAAIAHPGIVRVTDAGVTPAGELYLVMELLAGETLRGRLERGRLSPAASFTIVLAMLDALAAAHEARVIHRDLKPENVFLATGSSTQSAGVKLLDFGIAKVTKPASAGMTATGSMMGTVEYMSPEQIRDTAHVDHRADLWSVAVVLYEALTGSLPFVGASSPEIVVAVLSQPAIPPSRLAQVPHAVDVFFERALAQNPAARFASAAEMAAALRAIAPDEIAHTGYAAPSQAPVATPAHVSVRPPSARPPSMRPPGPGTLAGMRAEAPLPHAPTAQQPPQAYPVEVARPARPAPSRAPLGWILGGLAALLLLGGLVSVVILVLVAGAGAEDEAAERARCEHTCADIERCSGVGQSGCAASCMQGGRLKAYAQRHRRGDCRGIANAAFEVNCHAVPSGRASCREAMSCEVGCQVRGGAQSDVDACLCGCVRGLSPERAAELYANNLCGVAFCDKPCRTQANAAACGACMTSRCKPQVDACRAR